MHIVLVPGLWLDASSWDGVVPALRAAGHRTHALTLPGLESRDADRSATTLRDHVDAVVGAVDAVDPREGPVLLVGHSAGAALAHAAVDARPERVARVVHVDALPPADGDAINAELPAVGGEVPLPDWSLFDDDSLADLDDAGRAAFRDRAVPAPLRVVRDPMRLTDERRYAVPASVIACEMPSSALRELTAAGHPYTRELSRVHDVTFVDLPTGHWPQFTRPAELARALLDAAAAHAPAG